jgi:hypothetical protein
MRTSTTLFTHSKPSAVKDKLLILIQAKEEISNGVKKTIDVNLNSWVVEFPKESPKVKIEFMRVKDKKMVCI